MNFVSSIKLKAEEEKVKVRTQVQRSDFRDSAKVEQLRQIGAEMFRDSKVTA